MAWLSGFSYRKKITIDELKVDADLTDFPVLVKLTSTNFDFTKALSTGYDIRFTSSDGETLLKYERERHDATNSLAEYHVKVPSVSGTVDTDFYIYYGNSGAADGADPTNVWDANFKQVLHANDLTTSSLKDSTVNGNNGTKKAANEPIEADAKIGKGQDFDGVNDYLYQFATDPDYTAQTLEAWVNLDTLTETKFLWIWSYTDTGANEYSVILTDGTITYKFYGGTCGITSAVGAITTGSWIHLVFTRDAANGGNVALYKNGSSIASGVVTCKTSNAGPLQLGCWVGIYPTQYVFDGKMDEIRLSNLVRSAAWIKASYNSGNDSLVSYGGEEIPEVTTSSSQTTSSSSSSSSSSQTTSSSSTIIENKIYTRGTYASLPLTNANLTTPFSVQDYTDVSLDDATRVNMVSGQYAIKQFKNKNTNNTDEIHVQWNGQSDLAPSQSKVALEIYNHNTDTWVEIDSDNATGVNTDFDLNGDITENISNYYDGGFWVCHRVYQQKV